MHALDNGNKVHFEFSDSFWLTIQPNKSQVVEKVAEKVVEKVVEKLTDNQKLIVQLISANQHVTASKLEKEVGISHRKIQENISKLKEKGILKRIGPAKGGHWEVVK